MSDPFPYPERPVDRAVRARLDGDGQAANAEQLLAGVQARLAADAVRPARRGWRRVLAAAGVLAASVLLAGIFLIPGGSIAANPREMVERARTVHHEPVDRCYAVRVEVPAEVRRRFPNFNFGRESKLWTRGDRYFVELPNGRGVWGRDEANRVWFTPTPDAAARFDDDEVPDVFREFLDIRAVNLTDLLGEVLAHCDLSWASNVDTPTDIRRVYAVSREGGRSLRMAVIDVDRKTDVVRRLALDRHMFGDMRLKASVSFTLVEASSPDPSLYTPEGHLKAGAPIYDRTNPPLRRALLVRHLGQFRQE